MIFANTVSFSILLARQISQAIVYSIAKRADAASGAENPQGDRKMSHHTVATLANGNKHCLRAAPCVEASCKRCIRNYHVEGVLDL